MSTRRRRILGIASLAVFVLLGGIVLQRAATATGRGAEPVSAQATRPAGRPAAMQVELAEVERGDVSAMLELTGNFVPRQRTVIVAEVDGVIRSIPRSGRKIEVEIGGRQYSQHLGLDLGQPVSKGDVLVQIDPVEYQLELDAARARLEKARRDLDELQAWHRPEEIRRREAARDEAAARLEQKRAELQRAEHLRTRGVLTESDFDAARAEFRSAQAAFDRALADLEEAKAGPTATQIAVSEAMIAQAEADVRLREDRLARTTIRAPYDAVIVDRYVDEGQRVTSQPRVDIMELVDLSLVLVQVGIPERYLHRVQIEDWVTVKAEGVTGAVPGLVILVNDKGDPETRTFRVRVAVENPERRFKAGQFVRVGFNIATSEGAVVVPSQAVVWSGGQPQVFVYGDDGRVTLTRIRTGLSGNGRTEVLQGLATGDRVVVRDPSLLTDGMAVTAKPDGSDAGRRASVSHASVLSDSLPADAADAPTLR